MPNVPGAAATRCARCHSQLDPAGRCPATAPLIRLPGPAGGHREYGTAQQLVHRLGADITVAMVRRWADRDRLTKVTVPGPGRGTVRYPLDQAAQIERDKRLATRGRPRRLDIATSLT